MKLFMAVPVLFCIFVLSLPPAAAENRTLAGFEKIRSLVGEWEGTLPDGNTMRVTYEEINGGVIEERYRSQDPMWWNMSTVYLLDNGRIMMAHYCSWGNHPRMTAVVPDGETDRLDFKFLDMVATQPENGYMENVSFHFQDNDHFTHHWLWREKGKETPLALTMVRKKAALARR